MDYSFSIRGTGGGKKKKGEKVEASHCWRQGLVCLLSFSVAHHPPARGEYYEYYNFTLHQAYLLSPSKVLR